MGFEFQSKDEAIKVLGPELTTPEAISGLPDAQALYLQRVQEHDQARDEAKRLETIGDTNRETLRFLRSKQADLSTDLKAFRAASNTELYELRGDSDVEGIGALIRTKADAIQFLDAAYDHLLLGKEPQDQIAWLDSLVQQAVAEHSELSQAAVLSRMRTIAALGPILALEGGEVGIIGAGSERLKSAAQAALKRVEKAQEAARDARQAFERAEAARISIGVVASPNGTHGIPQ